MSVKGRKLLSLILSALMLLGILSGCGLLLPQDTAVPEEEQEAGARLNTASVSEDGSYDSKEDVALYIHTYGHLPPNYMTKAEARDSGWEGGSLRSMLPGMCIGGDIFRNREGLLPSAPGRTWTECDINTLSGSSRGTERIVFSNDGLIYYTSDHYESFELLFGGD